MRKLAYITFLLLAITARAQEETEFKPSHQMSGLIFTDLVTNVGPTTAQTNGFEVARAYFGYKNNFLPNWSARITLDIGAPDDASEFQLERRFAYFKYAGLQYKKDRFEGAFGIIAMHAFKDQEKFWGRRYMMHSFMDRYKFGPSADIGAFGSYKVTDWFKAEVTVSNGEGNNKIQEDSEFKYAVGTRFDFLKYFVARFYFDYAPHDGGDMKTYSSFLGFKTKKFSLAGEANYQEHYRFNEGDRFGYSMYTTYWITEKFDVFWRYDILHSNILEGEDVPWNISSDGSEMRTGVEYFINKHVRASVNYRDWVPWASNLDASQYAYLNVEIKF